MWVARDKINKLYLFTTKPYKKIEECDAYTWHPDSRVVKLHINDSLFPNLKWEDEPLEVDLYVKDKQVAVSKVHYQQYIRQGLKCK